MNEPYPITAKEFLKELHETHLHQRSLFNFEIKKAGIFYPVPVVLHVGDERIKYYDREKYQVLNWDVTPGDRFRLNGQEYEIKEEWSMLDKPPKISKEFLKVMGFEQDGLPDQWQLTLPLETGVTTTLSVMPGNGRCDLIQKEHPGNIMSLGEFTESEIKDLITALTKRGTGYVWFSRSHVIDYDSKILTPQHLDSFFEELEDWLVKRSMETPKEPDIMIYRNKWGVAAKLTSLWRGWFFENGLSFISKELLERNK